MDDQPSPPNEFSFNHSFCLDPDLVEAVKALTEIENLEKRLKTVRGHDWNGKCPEKIWKLLCRYLKYMPIQTSMALPHDIDQLKVYRCRLNIDEAKEPLDLWSTYSSPPPHLCNENGRANVKGMPVFYCSDHPTGALAEVGPEIGDQIYHTEWFIRSFRATTRTIIFADDISPRNPWQEIARGKRSVEFHALLDLYGAKVTNRLNEVLTFVAELFISEPEPYPISSAIAYRALFGKMGADYLVYPSFQNNGASSNIAFHPNFVTNNMILNKILVLEVLESKQEGVFVKHIRTGQAIHNHIIWRPPHPSELDFEGDNRIT